MRGLAKSAAALVGVAAMVMTGCGVAAPKNIASVDGVGVTFDDLERTARDPLYELVSPDADEATLPGDAARQALVVNLNRAAWIAEAELWDLDITSKREDAEANLDQQLASMQEPPELSKEAREGFIQMFAAQFALQERFEKIDPTSEDDLRRIYELSPKLWDQTCASILLVPDGAEHEVRSLIDRDIDLEQIADRVEGAMVVTTPDDGCMSQASIPAAIRDDLRKVPVGGADFFDVDNGGMTQRFLIEVASRETVRFDDARDDLAGIAVALAQNGPQEWVALRLADADIDPRIGSAISSDSQGQSLVTPPAGPLQSRSAIQNLGLDMIDG